MPDTPSPPHSEPSCRPQHADPIVGIDLGTTNSLVAVAHWPPEHPDPAPRTIPDAQGRHLLPSVVRFAPGDEMPPVVGHEARAEAPLHPRWTVASVKRLMGRSLDDAAPDLPHLTFDLVAGEHETARILLPDGRTKTPQEVSALILRELRQQAGRALGVDVHRAVITVPAYFDDAQRQATRDAARLAGLEAVRIVNEPTAAALAYGVGLRAAAGGSDKPATIAVFDLGGGTFDVSILRLTPAQPTPDADAGPAPADAAAAADAGPDLFQVISTAGDTHLGGDDLDAALVSLMTREMQDRFAPAPAPALVFPPETRRALRDLAERAKVRLSDDHAVPLRIDLGEGRVYERTLTRGDLEDLARPLIDRTLDACRRALRDARRTLPPPPAGVAEPGPEAPEALRLTHGAAIDAVVLVGGVTRMPAVREAVRRFFGLEPYTAIDPDRVVALGAAVQAAVLDGRTRNALLLDVVPLSLGIETLGGGFAKLILRNSTVPARASEMFSTSADGQTSIKVHVLQGEREMASDCRSLGVVHLSGIPPMPAGIPQVRVTFSVDASGILNVAAAELRSGARVSLQVVPSHGLTRDEVRRIEDESFAHAREDMQRHRVADLVAQSRLDLHWTRRQLQRHRAALDPGYAEALDRRLDELDDFCLRGERDWRSVDAGAFHRAKEALDRESMRLHEIAITSSLRDHPAG